jgi:peptidoglycan/xylan/chitin deacetylase (PgdA/CDA1 family)
MSEPIWPLGKKSAVLLTFDFDAESDEVRTMPEKIVSISRAQYGARVGLRRVLNLLDRFGIKATFFIPGWVVENYPYEVKEVVARGHEVAAHGYLHEKASELTEEEERAVLKKALRAFESTLGLRPLGYRAPWFDLAPRSLRLISEAGFKYDSSLMSQDLPYVIKLDEQNLVELPVEWTLDDYPLFEIQRRSPREVYELWSSEFDALHEEGSLFNLTMHPEVIGRPARIKMLEELIVHMTSKDAVWLAKASEVVEWWLRSNKG